MTFRAFVCCRECGFREQCEPYIWHVENCGIICPNCGDQWATEEDYQFRKRLDELWDKYNPIQKTNKINKFVAMSFNFKLIEKAINEFLEKLK